MNEKEYKSMTLTQLSQLYRVSTKTLYKWLKRKGIIKNKREGYIFTPKEVKTIIEELGEPEL